MYAIIKQLNIRTRKHIVRYFRYINTETKIPLEVMFIQKQLSEKDVISKNNK